MKYKVLKDIVAVESPQIIGRRKIIPERNTLVAKAGEVLDMRVDNGSDYHFVSSIGKFYFTKNQLKYRIEDGFLELKSDLFDEGDGRMSSAVANLMFGIVYELLLSNVSSFLTNETPSVGDWCIEVYSSYRKEVNSLGIVREITPEGYITQTVLGKTVIWTDCKMVKLNSSLLDSYYHKKMLALLKEDGHEVLYSERII